ncbi:SDR family NAD(P)-dependent oxidoreductase [Nostocoides sp. HKS02]|uniref:SDR family NAD(P)-dependent oxidoreductase n=1 Tax=Nostocoides sp. HKS02 TaxID=1813880 RepID=UPI0012B45884|nr:SDR family NAD(P)-dependent oxidoreductase [Tetrasphaera sp. HKS02]QGN58987.1 SDR family oxidoreductase [Tetrasphaera sp. HKS02]
MTLPRILDLSGRVAVVTGAGSPTGIGYAAACHLGALGAKVVVAATTGRVHDRARELEDAGTDARGWVGDLTLEADADALVAQAYGEFGRLDILVNAAGMVSTSDPDYLEGDLLGTTPERWNASLRRNLDTAYLVSRAALPQLRSSGAGRVVMVASVTGPVMAMRGEVAYAAAKAGMLGLARAMAVDEARHGVTVNTVAPGWIATGSQTESERVEAQVTPLGRSGAPDEVASAIGWLASPGAAYVTGQLIVVDGGNSIAEERLVR